MKHYKRINFTNQYFHNAVSISGLLFIVIIFNCQYSNAQTKFTAEAPKSIPQNQNFKINFSLENGAGTDFTFQVSNDFEILGSPVTSTTTQIINGVMNQHESHSYLLHPKNQGEFTITGATIYVNGYVLKSNDVRIIVTKPSHKKSKLSRDLNDRKKQQKEIDNLFKTDFKRV